MIPHVAAKCSWYVVMLDIVGWGRSFGFIDLPLMSLDRWGIWTQTSMNFHQCRANLAVHRMWEKTYKVWCLCWWMLMDQILRLLGSASGSSPEWMVYDGISCENWWFRGTGVPPFQESSTFHVGQSSSMAAHPLPLDRLVIWRLAQD